MLCKINWLFQNLLPKDTNTKITIKNVKLERGGTATAWTVAPQDTDTLIQSVRTQMSDKIIEEVNNRKDGDKLLTAKFADYSTTQVTSQAYKSEISQAANMIYLTVNVPL